MTTGMTQMTQACGMAWQPKTVRLFITGFWLGSPPQGRRAGQTEPVVPQENFFIVVK